MTKHVTKYTAEFWQTVEKDLADNNLTGKITPTAYAEMRGHSICGFRACVNRDGKAHLFHKLRRAKLSRSYTIHGISASFQTHARRLGLDYTKAYNYVTRTNPGAVAEALGLPEDTPIYVYGELISGKDDGTAPPPEQAQEPVRHTTPITQFLSRPWRVSCQQ